MTRKTTRVGMTGNVKPKKKLLGKRGEKGYVLEFPNGITLSVTKVVTNRALVSGDALTIGAACTLSKKEVK